MNRVQFLDALRRHLDDLPSRQRDEIVDAYSQHIQAATAQGQGEREVVDRLGSPSACAKDARAGRLPGLAAASGSARRSSNPFEPQMAAKPQRIKAQQQDRQKYAEEPRGKKPWLLAIVVTITALIGTAFVLMRVLSSDGQLGYVLREQSFDLAGIRHIVVEDSNKTVRVSALTTSDVRVNYYEGHHESYELTLEDGTLTVRLRSDHKWYDDFAYLYDTTIPTLNLYLPPEYEGALTLTTNNGSIELFGLRQADSLTVYTSNGAISLEDSTLTGTLTATTSNSPIELQNFSAAEILLTDSNGALTLDTIDCQALTLITSNGTVTADQISARAQHIDIQTSNASVLGSIQGAEEDFTIDTITSNGRNHMTNRTGGARKLTIHTSNGTIDMDFVS